MFAYLRTTLRLPLWQIQEYLETMHGVRVSVGELIEVLHRVRKEGQGLLQGLKEEMRHSAQLHMDETGWREDGQNTRSSQPGFCFQPKYAAYLNLIEPWWKVLVLWPAS